MIRSVIVIEMNVENRMFFEVLKTKHAQSNHYCFNLLENTTYWLYSLI
jgi:hypothetical protein